MVYLRDRFIGISTILSINALIAQSDRCNQPESNVKANLTEREREREKGRETLLSNGWLPVEFEIYKCNIFTFE